MKTDGVAHKPILFFKYKLANSPQQILDIVATHVAQDDDRVLAGIGLEQPAEVGAAGAQDDLVGGEGALVAGQRHVHEVLLVPQVPEGAEDRALEVVPLEGVVLLLLLLLRVLLLM